MRSEKARGMGPLPGVQKHSKGKCQLTKAGL